VFVYTNDSRNCYDLIYSKQNTQIQEDNLTAFNNPPH